VPGVPVVPVVPVVPDVPDVPVELEPLGIFTQGRLFGWLTAAPEPLYFAGYFMTQKSFEGSNEGSELPTDDEPLPSFTLVPELGYPGTAT